MKEMLTEMSKDQLPKFNEMFKNVVASFDKITSMKSTGLNDTVDVVKAIEELVITVHGAPDAAEKIRALHSNATGNKEGIYKTTAKAVGRVVKGMADSAGAARAARLGGGQ